MDIQYFLIDFLCNYIATWKLLACMECCSWKWNWLSGSASSTPDPTKPLFEQMQRHLPRPNWLQFRTCPSRKVSKFVLPPSIPRSMVLGCNGIEGGHRCSKWPTTHVQSTLEKGYGRKSETGRCYLKDSCWCEFGPRSRDTARQEPFSTESHGWFLHHAPKIKKGRVKIEILRTCTLRK